MAALRQALEQKPELVNLGDPERGATALHWAAGENQGEALSWLLANHADVNACDKEGQTPLHWAALRGRTEAARLLLQAGADVALQDHKQAPAWAYAVAERHSQLADLLLQAEAEAIALLQKESAPPGAIWLDQLDISSMTAGWGKPVAGASLDKHPLRIGDLTFVHGVGTHALSEFTLALHGAATHFKSVAGVDQEVRGGGSVVFSIFADGTLVARSGVLRGQCSQQLLSVDLRGKQTLRLVVDDASDGDNSDHSDWAGAALFVTSAWREGGK